MFWSFDHLQAEICNMEMITLSTDPMFLEHFYYNLEYWLLSVSRSVITFNSITHSPKQILMVPAGRKTRDQYSTPQKHEKNLHLENILNALHDILSNQYSKL
jgi:hypothetical protein